MIKKATIYISLKQFKCKELVSLSKKLLQVSSKWVNEN